MKTIHTRMGDGSRLQMTPGELTRDLEEGTADAAERAGVDPLAGDELRHLEDIFSSRSRFVAVDEGREVVLTYDGAPLKMIRTGVSVNRIQSMQIYEKLLGADTLEMAHVDYSYKPVKSIVSWEQSAVEQALLITVPPMFYGAMPNLGLYSQPDGPFGNPSELLPSGRIEEAMASYEAAVEAAVRDIVFIASAMVESGVDGINLDTVGAAGDADALAGLLAAEQLRARYPDICIELGMAGEFILGLHGGLSFHGRRLAGLYPHQQVKMAEKAGVTIFGPAINTNTSKSIPWNLARAITFIKACCEVSAIPVHANMGMGVGAVTVTDNPPVDVLTRATKAMVEICRLDGL
jgi:dimethylamine---corrinoid protein Co-methyltransferase